MTGPEGARSAVGPAKPLRRIHAAVFASQDPAARTTLLVAGTIANVQANAPPGGCWRQVPARVHRAGDVPPLGQLPPTVIEVNIDA